MMNNELMSSKSYPVPHTPKWAAGIRTVIHAGILTMALLLTGCQGLIDMHNGQYFPNAVAWFPESPKYGYEVCLTDIQCACFPFVLASDIILLPYDTYLRTKGFYIRVQDESGEPISGAEVNVCLDGYKICYEGKTNSRGIRYVPRSRDYCGRNRVSVFCVAKNFESLEDDYPVGTFAQDMKTNDWTIIMHRERKE